MSTDTKHRWQEIAKARHPGVEVTGNGRFALCWLEKGTVIGVYLFYDEASAKSAAKFYDYSRVEDLMPCPCPTTCKDMGYRDRD